MIARPIAGPAGDRSALPAGATALRRPRPVAVRPADPTLAAHDLDAPAAPPRTVNALPDAPISPLQYFALLVADDADIPLLEASISIGQDLDPELDVSAVQAQLDAWCEQLRRRMPEGAPALQRLRFLNRFFFHDLGFAGNVNHYGDPANSYLHRVMATRRGIPITLALLYCELAEHAGLQACGINFPGHFLVKMSMPRGEAVIDPFSGQSLSRDQLSERVAPYCARRGLVGDFDAPLELFLQEAPPRDILARQLRNLKELHLQSRDSQALLPVMDRLVALLPQTWEERRDRGLALERLGRLQEAAADLTVYLDRCAGAEDAAPVTRRLDALQRQIQRSGPVR